MTRERYYVTTKTQTSTKSECFDTLEQAIGYCIAANPYEYHGPEFKIEHYETVAHVVVRGRVRDTKGNNACRTAVSKDIGQAGVRNAVDKLLAQFSVVNSVEVKMVNRPFEE